MTYVIFHYQGNTTDVRGFGRSALLWMLNRWNDSTIYGGADYSHGWLIPIFSLVIVWLKRKELAAAPKQVSMAGLAVVILALLMHWLGAKSQQTRLSLMGLVTLLWGLPFYLCGWNVARLLIFPCAYLIFCIPLNFLDSVTFPLRLLATAVAAGMLNGLGIGVERSGSVIHSLSGGFNFDVADPCSGIKSLLAMMALASAYAYFTQPTLIKQWILFIASIPLAIIGNVARIVTVGLIAEAFGEELAAGIYHDYSGYIFFPIAVILMIGLGRLMNVNVKELRERWKHAFLNPTSP